MRPTFGAPSNRSCDEQSNGQNNKRTVFQFFSGHGILYGLQFLNLLKNSNTNLHGLVVSIIPRNVLEWFDAALVNGGVVIEWRAEKSVVVDKLKRRVELGLLIRRDEQCSALQQTRTVGLPSIAT